MIKEKCRHCSIDIFKKIEEEYNISIYEIKYYSRECKTSVEQRVRTNRGIGFRKWSKKIREEEDARQIQHVNEKESRP